MTYIDSAAAQFLTALRVLQQRASRAQQQIASGLRVASVADQPDAVPLILQLQTEVAAMDRLRQNLGRVRGEVDTAESAIQDAIRLVDQARVLGLQGGTSVHSLDRRALLARQVSGLAEQMAALVAIRWEGRAVFAADAADQRMLRHPSGTMFSVTKTAEEVFHAPSAGAVAALDAVRQALEQDDGPEGIGQALEQLRAAGDHLNQQLAWYGNLQNRIAAASDLAEKFQIQGTVRLAEMREADLPAAIVELTQAQNGMQAALSAQARTPRRSLFDYL